MNRRPFGRSGVLLLAIFLCAACLRADTIRLRRGGLLIGKIEHADENGLSFRRADTGGLLELRWSDLAAPDAVRIREAWSLIDPSAGNAVLTKALKVEVERPGGTRQTLVGELVSRDGRTIVLRKKTLVYKVRVADLRGIPETLEVPIREVLTPDQIYERKRNEIDPGEDPDKHALLADYLIRVEDYARAKEHLLKAKELGGGKQAGVIDQRIAKVDTLLNNKEQADLLAKINILRNRKDFAGAGKVVEEFEKRFPDSPLRGEFENRKKKLEEARKAYLVRKVAGAWFDSLLTLSKIAATDRSLGIEQAKTLAQEKIGEEIRARIAKKYGLEESEVETFFRERMGLRGLKEHKANYGTGSWVLGKDGVLKGTKIGQQIAKKKAGPKGGKSKRIREIERRLREFLKRVNRGGGGKGGAVNLETPEQWWKRATSLERQQWIMAYYAENGGDYELMSAHLRACPTCGSNGYLETQGPQGGRTLKLTCPTCHGTRFFRILRFR